MIGNDGLLGNPGMTLELVHPFAADIAQRTVLKVPTVADLPTAGPINEGVMGIVTGTAGSGSSGPLSPGTLASDATGSGGSVAWTTPSNAASSNNVYASAVLDAETTHWLKATNFGFALAAGSTITGIVVEAECSISVGSLTTEITRARIIKGGAVGSTDNTNGTDFTTTDTYLTMGSSSNLWGETWAYTDINLSTFGFAVGVTATVGAAIAQIDHVQITVYYTTAAVSGGIYQSRRADDGTFSWIQVAT